MSLTGPAPEDKDLAILQKLVEMAPEAQSISDIIAILQQVIRIMPTMLEARHLLRTIEISQFETALSFTIPLMNVQVEMILAKAGGKTPKEIMDSAEEALAVNPYHAKANQMLAKAALELRYYDVAAFAYETHVQNEPEDKESLHRLADVYAQSENLSESKEVYEQILELDPDDGEASDRLRLVKKRLDLKLKAEAEAKAKAEEEAEAAAAEEAERARQYAEDFPADADMTPFTAPADNSLSTMVTQPMTRIAAPVTGPMPEHSQDEVYEIQYDDEGNPLIDANGMPIRPDPPAHDEGEEEEAAEGEHAEGEEHEQAEAEAEGTPEGEHEESGDEHDPYGLSRLPVPTQSVEDLETKISFLDKKVQERMAEIEDDPDMEETHANELAQLYYDINVLKLELEQTQLYADPENLFIRLDLGEAYSRLGMFAEAMAEFEHVADDDTMKERAYIKMGQSMTSKALQEKVYGPQPVAEH
ncbi:MAG TPA: tetratricopeptide repeat protein [Candidatus Methylacidiphilales bacterium]|nr:tetratricopeptide repeat protein [Candidatus Methylacidiphilales bacterium]